MSQPNAASVKEKKTSDKDLDLSNCNRGVWLVKVPKYIADRWESVEPNATVGKVKLAKRPGEKPLITLSLDDKVSQQVVFKNVLFRSLAHYIYTVVNFSIIDFRLSQSGMIHKMLKTELQMAVSNLLHRVSPIYPQLSKKFLKIINL